MAQELTIKDIQAKRDRLQDDIYGLVKAFWQETHAESFSVTITPIFGRSSFGTQVLTDIDIEIPIII